MKKIGLLGGTFDPVHNGHLIISEYLYEELDLDEIWFIPAHIHPLKDNNGISDAGHRLSMLQLAVADNDHFKISELEISREGVSYTVDTLDQLHKTYRDIDPRFFYFIGMDNVNDLPRWKKPWQILENCQVVAFGRPGFKPDPAVEEYLPHIRFIHVPLLEISSTLIRKRVTEENSVRYLVPEAVRKYISDHGLYRSPGK